MRYPVVFFDADDTLFDFEKTKQVALDALFVEAGFPRSEALTATYERINQQLWQELEQGRVAPATLKVERFARFCTATGLAGDPEWLSTRYLQRLSQGTDLLPGAEQLVQTLHGSVRLALITNGLQAVQRPRFAQSPLCKCFEVIVVSEEVGIAKPNPEIFRITWEQMGCPELSGILMVGDSLASDIQGGVNFGIATCWYNPNQLPLPAEPRIDHNLTDLTKFPELMLDRSV